MPHVAALCKCFILIWTAVLLSSSTTIDVKIMTNPVVFGEGVNLVCLIYTSDKPEQMAWKKIPYGQTIAFNNRSADASKYVSAVKYEDANMTYTLLIKEFSQTDVNCIYKCESGFDFANGNVTLNEDEFIGLPRMINTNWTVTLKDGVLNGIIKIADIFPQLQCIVLFEDVDITNKSNIKFVQTHLLYTLDITINFNTTECGGFVSVMCKGRCLDHYVGRCENSQKQESIFQLELIPVVFVIIAVPLAVFCIYRHCRGRCHLPSLADRHVSEAERNDSIILEKKLLEDGRNDSTKSE